MLHLSRPGVVESARADRVRGATSPDNAHPSPQPSPARERGSVAPNRTGAADFPARCNAIGRGSSAGPPGASRPRRRSPAAAPPGRPARSRRAGGR
ncbi:hypothetical protein F6X53_09245 [Methylobacterium soli]|uniref:Uncharacterized protein n=1 Tax=Methylobacterium soli TaxID=553447 RepID=A0A6L3T0I4_9HYPH|nr:hypothetical protein F6X53_09245 [Methylobacterium soli]